MKHRRLVFLDYAKGIGILLVILGHIYGNNNDINRKIISVFIYSFHMPLFFIISGILIKYNNEKFEKKLFYKMFCKILVPYLLFSFIKIIDNVVTYKLGFNNFILNCLDTFLGLGIDVLWFLPALFIGKSLFLIFNYYINNKYIRLTIIIMFFLISMFITEKHSILLIILARSIIALGFITIGYYLYEFIISKNIIIIYLIFLLIIQVIFSKMNGFVDLNNLVFNNKFLYLFNSLNGAI